MNHCTIVQLVDGNFFLELLSVKKKNFRKKQKAPTWLMPSVLQSATAYFFLLAAFFAGFLAAFLAAFFFVAIVLIFS